MADQKDATGKPTNTPPSRAVAGNQLADLLGSADYGVRAKGVVMTITEPEHVQGKNEKGRPYSFYSRRFQVFTGNDTVEIAEVRDGPEEFQPVGLYSVGEFDISGARLRGNLLTYSGTPAENG